ncbi:MAG: hypothetical protein FWG66_02345, partial [Spirochaetes bacterium]|nr:hypothetical protein [Spirochaetota bacterium]
MKKSGRKAFFALLLISILLSFPACDQMDNMVVFPVGLRQVQVFVNNVAIDENAFVSSACELRLHFANFDPDDPDITGMLVFLSDSQGRLAESATLYLLQRAAANPANVWGEPQHIVEVSRLDGDIPLFEMPQEMPAGLYTIVAQVLAGGRVLFQNQYTFYYLADAGFVFQDIQMFLPNAVASSRIVPGGETVMLEARAFFDGSLNPHIVWLDGRRVISEGSFSEGAQRILWPAPELNSFVSLRAEIFPVRGAGGLPGISREISLPVSTRIADSRAVSADSQGLARWFLFAGNLADSLNPASAASQLRPQAGNLPVWLPAGGSFGLASGPQNTFSLTDLSLQHDGHGRFLFRFSPVSDGSIFSASFDGEGSADNIEMNLSLENEMLVLSLRSSSDFADLSVSAENSSLVTGTIDFSIGGGRLQAALEIADGAGWGQSGLQPAHSLALNASLAGGFSVLFGSSFDGEPAAEAAVSAVPGGFTAIWDEFAWFTP